MRSLIYLMIALVMGIFTTSFASAHGGQRQVQSFSYSHGGMVHLQQVYVPQQVAVQKRVVVQEVQPVIVQRQKVFVQQAHPVVVQQKVFVKERAVRSKSVQKSRSRSGLFSRFRR